MFGERRRTADRRMKDKEEAACSGAQSFKRESALGASMFGRTWIQRGQQGEAKGRLHHLAGMNAPLSSIEVAVGIGRRPNQTGFCQAGCIRHGGVTG